MLNKMKGNGLKTSFRMLLAFFLICSVGTVLSACLYMIYSSCTLLIAGDAFDVFSKSLFLEGIVKALPVCIAISSILLALYLIRHPSEVVCPLITYLILGLASWFVLLPLTNTLSLKLEGVTGFEKEERPLSENYFRKSNDQISYISTYNADGNADGTVIELSPVERGVYSFTEVPLAERSSEFSDSLIEESVTVPFVCRFIINSISVMFSTGRNYLSKGYLNWIFFATCGLAILSLLGLKRMSSWRLINVFTIVSLAVIIFSFNAAYYGQPEFQKYTFKIDQWFLKFPIIPNPCAVLFNLIVTLVFSVFGIINAIIKAPEKPKKQKLPKKPRVKNAKKAKPAKLPVADKRGIQA